MPDGIQHWSKLSRPARGHGFLPSVATTGSLLARMVAGLHCMPLTASHVPAVCAIINKSYHYRFSSSSSQGLFLVSGGQPNVLHCRTLIQFICQDSRRFEHASAVQLICQPFICPLGKVFHRSISCPCWLLPQQVRKTFFSVVIGVES